MRDDPDFGSLRGVGSYMAELLRRYLGNPGPGPRVIVAWFSGRELVEVDVTSHVCSAAFSGPLWSS